MIPGRFTPRLIDNLKRFSATYVMCHFSHPYELSPDVLRAAAALADVGIQLRAHTPLLRGINDAVPTLSKLFDLLVDARIQPYHMLQFIPTSSTEHFRVPFRRALRIYEALQAESSGLALPTFVVYLPHGNGKAVIAPNRVIRQSERGFWLRSVRGREVLYEEPGTWQTDAISA
jgi:lysine 2,3-aminomutase